MTHTPIVHLTRCYPRARCLLALTLLLGCSGHYTDYKTYYVDGSAGALTGGTAGLASGGAPASAGSSAHGGMPVARGGAAGSEGGVAGKAGESASGSGGLSAGVGGVAGEAGGPAGGAGGSAGAGSPCIVDADCPLPPTQCLIARCEQGLCSTRNAAQGSMLVADTPADCHALACDGLGNYVRVVDQANVLSATSPCFLGACNSAGTPSTEPTAAGTPCSNAQGGVVCDGAKNCVQCLHSSDCPNGMSCSATERCVAPACTDVDCGGACPPCGDGKKCLTDTDCASYACDAALHTCDANQCADQQQDGLETDTDCGGGACPPCALTKGCLVSADCASNACDAIKLVCIGNSCADHRKDGFETDIDCGGGGCGACNVGQTCSSNFDCVSGHFCNGIKVCQ